MIAWPELIVSAFSADPAVRTGAAAYLRIIGWCQLFQAWEIIAGGAFAGSGDTLPTLLVGVPLTLARVPLAAWLAVGLGWGLEGVFCAISLSTSAKGIVLAIWWRRRARTDSAPVTSCP